MFQHETQIAWNRPVAPGVFAMGLTCRSGFARAKPGQFIMLRVSDGIEPLLRRPFSIHKLISAADRIDGIELLYKVVGKGTALLAARRMGETLDVLGPSAARSSCRRRPAKFSSSRAGWGWPRPFFWRSTWWPAD